MARSFDGWQQDGNWIIDEDGAFYRNERGGSLTYTKATVPDDFELRFEWKVSEGCNSGLYYRPAQYEYQVLDNIGSPYGENPETGRRVAVLSAWPHRRTTPARSANGTPHA